MINSALCREQKGEKRAGEKGIHPKFYRIKYFTPSYSGVGRELSCDLLPLSPRSEQRPEAHHSTIYCGLKEVVWQSSGPVPQPCPPAYRRLSGYSHINISARHDYTEGGGPGVVLAAPTHISSSAFVITTTCVETSQGGHACSRVPVVQWYSGLGFFGFVVVFCHLCGAEENDSVMEFTSHLRHHHSSFGSC